MNKMNSNIDYYAKYMKYKGKYTKLKNNESIMKYTKQDIQDIQDIQEYYRLKSRSEITMRHPDEDGVDNDNTVALSSLVVFFLGGERFLGARCS